MRRYVADHRELWPFMPSMSASKPPAIVATDVATFEAGSIDGSAGRPSKQTESTRRSNQSSKQGSERPLERAASRRKPGSNSEVRSATRAPHVGPSNRAARRRYRGSRRERTDATSQSRRADAA